MKVYGLSGKSGTGKSYNAAELCVGLQIDGLIDDGLFIWQNKIIEGESAKKQPTKIGAVKAALFTDDEHCEKIKFAIHRINPEGILILGTSDDMVERIANRLNLPKPDRIIHIEEISTEEQRKAAQKARETVGTHVIPAPTLQLKRQFSGYILDPRKSFRTEEGEKSGNEKTLVRPTYSYLGNFTISDKVISDITVHLCKAHKDIASVLFVAAHNESDGMYIRIILIMNYGCRIRDTAEALQLEVAEAVNYMTAFNVIGVEVEIRGFKFK